MKTMTYRGTLVDLSCGSATASGGAGASDTKSATRGRAAAQAADDGRLDRPGAAIERLALGDTNAAAANTSANRSAGDSSNCPVTANSSQLGLKMDNGQVVRFDLVGNQRAQDELKNNKKWTNAVSSSKPIKVKISGVMQGDKLIVSSINSDALGQASSCPISSEASLFSVQFFPDAIRELVCAGQQEARLATSRPRLAIL